MTKITELDPLCLKTEFEIIDGVRVEKGMQAAIDNRGRLIPCCYCDTPTNELDENYQKLLKVSNIEDYDNIEEIYLTKEWIEFVQNLKDHKGFFACRITCPKRTDKKNVVRKERIYNKGNLSFAKDF